MTPSVRLRWAIVGWSAQVASHCALLTPIFTAMAANWIISGASGATMWQPTILSVAATTISFIRQRSSPPVKAYFMGRNRLR